MKVSLVGYTTPMSGNLGTSLGISKYIYYVGKELIKLGHDVELLIRDDYKPKENWIKTIRAPKTTWSVYPFFIFPHIINKKSDIFHSDYINTGAPLIWAKKHPSVVTMHDAFPFYYNPKDLTRKDKIIVKIFKFYFKFAKKADAIVLRSNWAKEDALKHTNIPEEKLFVNFGGLDPKMYYPMKKKSHDKIKIGYLGGLEGRKNVILLVETFKKLVNDYDNIELHVGGGGRNVQKFRDMKIKNSFFHGFIPDEKVNEFLNSLDIFVYPTLGEGLGSDPIQAMGCGLPVIASNRSSMPEVIGDAGILAEPNVKSMYNAIARLIENENLRKKIAKKCFERSKELTWERCIQNVLEVYDAVMK